MLSLFVLAFLLALAIPATRTMAATVSYATAYESYHIGEVQALQDHPLPADALVYWNRPEVAWAETGVDAVQYSPMPGRYIDGGVEHDAGLPRRDSP